MSTFHIRAATLDDAAALADFLRELGREPGLDLPQQPGELAFSVDEERERLALLFASPGVLFVAVAGGEIVGELSVRAVSRLEAVRHVAVLGISVRADWRGRGVGAALMAEAVAWTPRAGFTRLELNVFARNAPAIRLYERFGFELEGRRRRYIREGDAYLDDLVMARLF